MPSRKSENAKLSYFHNAGDTALSGRSVGEVLNETASLYPEHSALVVRHQKRRYTYREFLAKVEIVARGFLHLGVQKGDRVGIWATNCEEWVFTQFATAKIGAILVNINPAYRANELEYALQQSECQTLLLIRGFRDCDYISTLFSICPESRNSKPGTLSSDKLPYLKNVIFIGDEVPGSMCRWSDLLEWGQGVPERDLRHREAILDCDDAINIQYTSGTTGFPKGVMLSHHNIVNNAILVGRSMRITHRDKICIPVPFYHCFGMVLGNMVCILAGAAMVVPAEYFDALATLEAVEEEHCTALYGVPTMFIAELEHSEFSRFDLRSLRTGIMAGAPCPIEVMKRVVEDMHCREITIAYGLTEASPVITQTTTQDPIEIRVTTVGKPLPYTEVKITDPQNGRIVPPGVQGELYTRGYLVMEGYYNNPEATKQVVDSDGWLRTGDLATMDENGYCRITGRVKDMIIRGGENIYPREIEEFLYGHPAISEVQVIGIPDRKYGEQVVAWVKPKEGIQLSAEDVQSFCKGKIADYKIPRLIKFVDSFPMTVTGKIQKFKMRKISVQESGLEEAPKMGIA